MTAASRALLVLAAVSLVGAIGLLALTPRGLTLEMGLSSLDPAVLRWLRSNAAFWAASQEPLFDRPVWFLPVGIGLVCAGLSASLNLSRTSHSPRRRS